MTFRRISYQIAFQFMTFVFLLSLAIGAIFLVADMENSHRGMERHLGQVLHTIVSRAKRPADIPMSLPPLRRELIRIVDVQSGSLFTGALYDDIPFESKTGVSTIIVDGEPYTLLTAPFMEDGDVVGYIQVAEHPQNNDLILRILLYLAISGALSIVVFGVGLYFARRSLHPAEQAMLRLEQFTEDASHELRTPLTAASTSLDLALATKDYRDNILSAKKDLSEITALVERLLVLAELDRALLKKEAVQLSSLVEEVIKKHESYASQESVALQANIAPNISVQGDSTLLRQVLSNLLTNAIKFNKPKGRVDVKLVGRVLTVRDTGRGISAEALPHIFDRFYQEDVSRAKKVKGLGLGLALVQRIIDLHGWTITAKSVLGEGTEFQIVMS